MPISSTTNKHVYTGDGATDIFPYTFKIFANTEIIVERLTIADGTTDTGTLNTHYTLSGVGSESGGNVTAIGDWENTSSSYKIILRRSLPLTQAIDLVNNQATPASTYEEAFDRAVMIAQQLQEQIDRSILASTDLTTAWTLPAASANKYIGWNSGATALENKTLSDLSAVAKASTAEAQAGTDDSVYMTPAKVKSQIEYTGAIKGSALAELTNIPASAGVIPVANIPTGTTADKVVKLDASARIPAVDASLVTGITAAQIGSGTIATARLGSGSASSANFLRGDQSWQVAPQFSNTVFSFGLGGGDSGESAPVWRISGGSPLAILHTKYKHISGVSTITVYGRIWDTDAAATVYLKCDIGSATGTTPGKNSDTAVWDSVAIDVSALTPGTVYDVIFYLDQSGDTADDDGLCDSIIGIAS